MVLHYTSILRLQEYNRFIDPPKLFKQYHNQAGMSGDIQSAIFHQHTLPKPLCKGIARKTFDPNKLVRKMLRISRSQHSKRSLLVGIITGSVFADLPLLAHHLRQIPSSKWEPPLELSVPITPYVHHQLIHLWMKDS